MNLPEHLSAQLGRLEQLQETLLLEQQQLLATDIDGRRLAQLADSKRALLEAIEDQETVRRKLQELQGWEAGAEGMRQAAARADCESLWASVIDLGERVARSNSRNGELIALRMGQNQRLLNALHDARGHHLYGPDGQTASRGSQVDSRA